LAAAQVVHRTAGHVVAADATDGVVGDGVHTVEADLDVEVVHRGQAAGLLGVDERTVGGELDADVAGHRVLDELEEVAAHHRLAAADVDVEDLQLAQLVEHPLGLGGGQLAIGSRWPDDDRQCTHCRLHAYVSSHVRQMGASSPVFSWATSDSALIRHPSREVRCRRFDRE
jgi:hypothetical protein